MALYLDIIKQLVMITVVVVFIPSRSLAPLPPLLPLSIFATVVASPLPSMALLVPSSLMPLIPLVRGFPIVMFGESSARITTVLAVVVDAANSGAGQSAGQGCEHDR
jgi:hypothetical protein